ncbi:MAG: DUF418 domain-containing protein [candidate division Zixibacteria bacterium]|nr:DUF418 domain-containing protein [candidate division Zixibacteria bacterium]
MSSDPLFANPENNAEVPEIAPAPIQSSQRIVSLDVLRGTALLGILVINIGVYALPGDSQFSPLLVGGTGSLNLSIWGIGTLLFFQKMMALFSMLFGAGIVLQLSKNSDNESLVSKIFFRRQRWLIIIGLLHAYLFWWGDILFFYGVCGIIVYLFRNLKARSIIITGLLIMCVTVPLFWGISALMEYSRDMMTTGEEGSLSNVWKEASASFNPTPEDLQKEIDDHTGSYNDLFFARAERAIMAQTGMLLFYAMWRVCGLMLIGMGLMKLRFFTAELPVRTYAITLAIGYGIGFLLSVFGLYSIITSGYDPIVGLRVMGVDDYIGSLFVSIGHASLIMIIIKSEVLMFLTDRLAAIGRVALSNYLFHTLVFTTVFYGYGLGLFGRFERFELALMVLAMWLFQLIVSPIWLRFYRFGPFEWLWRIVTYRKVPKFKRSVE